MSKNSHCLMQGGFLLFVLLGLWLLYEGTAWPVHPGIQQIMNDIENFTAAGEIHDASVADNLRASLSAIDVLIAEGDTNGAKALLSVFTKEVRALQDTLMSSNAATKLIDSADSLSSSL